MKAVTILILSIVASPAFAADVDCMETGAALDYWQPIRERVSAGDGSLQANELALQLVDCLGSPDPALRDRIGYELLTTWLRSGALTDNTRTALLVTLQDGLSESDPLRRSFSALILAEIMRSDAIASFMSSEQRSALLAGTHSALENESDYRGLDAELGWVHPVAHLADLLWRFSLHPDTSTADARALLIAVRTQVAPTRVAYAFNEGDRLARVVATIVSRELLPADELSAWISEFGSPVSMERWSQAFQSPAGMAELHNTKQFLRALSDQLATVAVPETVDATLAELVAGFTQLI
jgi:hypothetical protein